VHGQQSLDDLLPCVVVTDADAPPGGFVSAQGLRNVVDDRHAGEHGFVLVFIDDGDDRASRAAGDIGDDARVFACPKQDDLRVVFCHGRNSHIKPVDASTCDGRDRRDVAPKPH
jgi:hypothetical protein